MLKLFCFTDDIEEFLVSAVDANDAFQVIEENISADAADELVMSRLIVYPDDFVILKDGSTAKEVAEKGRRIVAERDLSKQGRFFKP